MAFPFDDDDAGLAQGWHRVSAENLRSDGSPFDRSITVPFYYQSKLSGIGDTSFHDVVWYARTFEGSPGEHLLPHFGAVDYRTFLRVGYSSLCCYAGNTYHGGHKFLKKMEDRGVIRLCLHAEVYSRGRFPQ